jgi:hypothetical protein
LPIFTGTLRLFGIPHFPSDKKKTMVPVNSQKVAVDGEHKDVSHDPDKVVGGIEGTVNAIFPQ